MKNLIELKNVDYVYPDGTKALHGVNFSAAEGDSVGIIGPNGAGKSTFLLHLNGILKGSGGIKILEKEIQGKEHKRILSKVGLVFQDPEDQLFMPTVFDNVAFGPMNNGGDKSTIPDLVKRTLEKVDMPGTESRCAHHISFGEKKRVALATVLSMNVSILVLDEPTSNLDPRTRRHFIALFRDIPITKVIASHDLEMILEVCNRVVVLSGGRIVAEGETRTILSDKVIMEENGLEVPLSLQYACLSGRQAAGDRDALMVE